MANSLALKTMLVKYKYIYALNIFFFPCSLKTMLVKYKLVITQAQADQFLLFKNNAC